MSEMYGVVKETYFCNLERTEELNERMYDRNIPSQPLQAKFGMRAVPTQYTKLAIVDQRPKATVPIQKMPTYNIEKQFNPGNAVAPWSGFATNINNESRLRNLFFGLQKCEQAEFVPQSYSDLYNVKVVSRKQPNPFPLLEKQDNFKPFNPNICNVGHEFFHNSTREQLLNTDKDPRDIRN